MARAWFDPLQIFAVSIAALVAAFLFLLAVMADVSMSTAATRAVMGWGVLSMVGIGMTAMVRWILRAPAPTAPGTRLDVTLAAEGEE
jgi:hypothetical protein